MKAASIVMKKKSGRKTKGSQVKSNLSAKPVSKAKADKGPAQVDHEKSPPDAFPIVGIGASAGGLEAFSELLSNLPADTGMAFVLVQHLAAERKSELPIILARVTRMPTIEARHNMRVKPNHVYVIPANTLMSISRGMLKLSERSLKAGGSRAIDFFFESLADDQREMAIGIILSGTASDGTLGLEAIKAEAGITFAQDQSAKYDSMPRSAISAGCVDLVLAPKGIALELAQIAEHPYVSGRSLISTEIERAREVQEEDRPTPLPSGGHGRPATGGLQIRREAAKNAEPTAADNSFREIMMLLRQHSGVDFSLYKSSTIQRRIKRRMVLNRMASVQQYGVLLKNNAKELDALFSDVLISVTSFFRNPEAFEVLRRKVFPKLFGEKGGESIRVWVLGCSTGQEAYSLAMVLEEFVDRIPRKPKLQIFATDLNESLLDKARAGLYSKSLVQDVSQERLRRFFVEEEGGYRISKRLRDLVVFARQNMLMDPPFSRMDLISCRNVLIYLEGSLQKRIIPTFHYALKPGGFLFLGASESIGTYTELFAPIDKKHKIYQKKLASTPTLNLQFSPRHPGEKKESIAPKKERAPEGFHGDVNAQREADRVALNRYVPASVLVDSHNHILHFRGDTSLYLKPPSGKPTFNLLQMAREGLMLPLRALLNKVKREGKSARREKVRVNQNGQARVIDLEAIPLKNLNERCYLVFFEDKDYFGTLVSPPQLPSEPAEPFGNKSKWRHRHSELERELAETRDYLQSIQEQYEAANEELQASNEEVTSANEELQSINEELETSKEELESTNEELTTVNEEMASRNQELSQLNSDLNNLYANVNMAIVLLARDLRIRRFTAPAERLFNLLATDVGRPIMTVRHNLEIPDLGALLMEVIDSVSVREEEVRASDGRWYALRARPYLTLDNKIDGAVLSVMDIDALKRSEQESKAARDRAQAILRTTPVPLLVLNENLRIEFANETFYLTFKTTSKETEGRLVYELGNQQWNNPKLRHFLEEIIPRNSFFKDFEVSVDFPHIGPRSMLLSGRRLEGEAGNPHRILLAIDDFTDHLRAQAALRASELRYRRLFEAARDGILIVDPETFKVTDANPYMTELLGCDREEVIGKELWEIQVLKNKKESQNFFAQLSRKGVIRLDDLRVVARNGERRDVELVANRYVENDDEVIQCNIRDVTERRQAEEQIKAAKAALELAKSELEVRVQERTAELREVNRRLKDLSARLITTQEQERARLARELHDEIGQALTSLKLFTQNLEKSELDGNAESLKQLQEMLSEVTQRVRQLSLDLHPQVLDDLGLIAALQWRFKSFSERTKIKVDFENKVAGVDLSNSDLKIAVFRIAQEALTNVARHAEVKQAKVRLFATQGQLHLEIHDYGKGFDPERMVPSPSFGLGGMRERVTLMDGHFHLESSLGKGTHLYITFPLGGH